MDFYYIDGNAKSSGAHEVHKDSCVHFKEVLYKIYLGYFSSSYMAVNEAYHYYSNVDACTCCCQKNESCNGTSETKVIHS